MAIAIYSSTSVELPKGTSRVQQSTNYVKAEKQFMKLLTLENLDREVEENPKIASDFETAIATALAEAYDLQENSSSRAAVAHLFLQRVLYFINRLNLFWYDDLQYYTNERSIYLQRCRDRIEKVWQAWESSQLNVSVIQQLDVKQALIDRSKIDLNPLLTANKRYLREDMTFQGYRYLLAIASLDGLVEASRLSRILGGASNEIQATLTRVFLEEYGNGRLARKHSTFFAKMMSELALNTEPEGYFNLVPWEILASINHNFLLTECKRYFLRYSGGLTYFEIAGPSFYTDYLMAAQRIGLSENAMGYWELHIHEDERHGQWMLYEVALPLAEKYPAQAWEIILGYDQEKLIGDRAGTALVKQIRQTEKIPL
jgi:Iron-containing redox enzyme